MSRAVRRFLVVVTGLALVAGMPATAIAAWTVAGTGSVVAAVTTLNRPAAPTLTRGSGSVGISWTASSTATGVAAARYDIVRHAGSTATTVCSGVTMTSCTDSAPVATSVTYGVVARLGSSWTSAESTTTSFTYDNVAPASSLSASPAANAAGWQNANVTATISATDTGSPASGVREIHYTVNGGTEVVATGSSTTVSVTQEQINTIVYWAVDNAGNAETPKNQAQVKLDKTTPVTTISPAGSTTTWRSSGTVTLTATDNLSGVAAISYKVDGGTSTTYSTPFTLTQGTHTVTYHATDVAGNVETDKTATIMVDTAAPTTTISPASSTTVWRSSGTVTLTATDNLSGVASISYKVDGGTLTTYTGTFTLAQGSHTVTYYATDNAGNVETTKTATIMVDTAAPTTTISPASSTTVWRSSGTVTLTATDNLSGVASISYKVDGGTLTTYTGTFTLAQGSHTVTYYATDNAGNVETTNSATIMVDTTLPTASANQASGSYTSSVTITGSDTGGSGVASIQYALDGATTYTTVSGTSATVTIPAGTHSLVYRAVDNAGNVGNASASATYYNDTASPTATITDPTAGSYTIKDASPGSWAKVCGSGRICANATDDVQIATVTYNLRATSGTNSGKCWTGATNGFQTGTTCTASMTGPTGTATGTWVGADIPRASMSVGNYTVTVTVTDGSGKSTTSSVVNFSTNNN